MKNRFDDGRYIKCDHQLTVSVTVDPSDDRKVLIEYVVPRRFQQEYLFVEVPTKSVKLIKPPKLYWDWLARRLMSPSQYKKLCEPHIADMHAQYFCCINKGDEVGARWAVIRGNVYAVPSWAWGALASLLLWLKHMVSH